MLMGTILQQVTAATVQSAPVYPENALLAIKLQVNVAHVNRAILLKVTDIAGVHQLKQLTAQLRIILLISVLV